MPFTDNFKGCERQLKTYVTLLDIRRPIFWTGHGPGKFTENNQTKHGKWRKSSIPRAYQFRFKVMLTRPDNPSLSILEDNSFATGCRLAGFDVHETTRQKGAWFQVVNSAHCPNKAFRAERRESPIRLFSNYFLTHLSDGLLN